MHKHVVDWVSTGNPETKEVTIVTGEEILAGVPFN